MLDHYLYHASDGRVLAYCSSKSTRSSNKIPGVVFLGGFRSDMSGSKALFLERWAAEQDRDYLRFDYTGHGQSSGNFLDGCIGDWAQDACDMIAAHTDGPQILVGSSMGGWIALLVAKRMAEKVAGLVGIAVAPDFTEDSMWAGFDATQRDQLMSEGVVRLPSDYSDEPYEITRRLIEDGREHLVLREDLSLPFPVRLLHGTADTDVDMSVPLRLLDHAECPDMRLTFVEGADHRFSSEDNLDQIATAVAEVDRAISA